MGEGLDLGTIPDLHRSGRWAFGQGFFAFSLLGFYSTILGHDFWESSANQSENLAKANSNSVLRNANSRQAG